MGAGASIDDDSIRVAITIYEESRTTLKSNSEILVDLKTALGIPTPSLSLMPLAMAAISELAASHILSKSLLNNNHANSNSLVPAPNDTSMITEPPFDLSSMLPPPRISFEESHSTPVHSNKSKSKAFSSLHIEVQDHMDIMEEDEIDSVQLKNSKGAFNLNEQGILTPENAQLTHYNPSDFIEVKQIGKGASGSVFLSLHRPTMSLVAIKSIAINSDAKRAQVASELKILYSNLAQIPQLGDTLIMANSNSNSNSNSEEIVKFYDAYSTNNNTVNIIMEYCSGGTLQDLIDRGGSQNEIVLAAIAHSVAKGLLFLHHKNNIHRDIKPNNILLTTDGKVKLADFGISKEVSETLCFALELRPCPQKLTTRTSILALHSWTPPSSLPRPSSGPSCICPLSRCWGKSTTTNPTYTPLVWFCCPLRLASTRSQLRHLKTPTGRSWIRFRATPQ